MTADYGTRSVRRGPSPFQILMVIGLVALIGALGFTEYNYWRGQMATARQWTVPGPACPRLSQAALVAAGLKAAPEGDLRGFPDMNTNLDDIRIGRRFGYASCAEIHDNGGLSVDTHPVCEFTRPVVVTVTTPKGVFYFNTGPTGPATVSVQDGVPSCVLANRLKVNHNYLTDPASINASSGAG
jgi:hypothetical protein